jgi:hypothetical protein
VPGTGPSDNKAKYNVPNASWPRLFAELFILETIFARPASTNSKDSARKRTKYPNITAATVPIKINPLDILNVHQINLFIPLSGCPRATRKNIEARYPSDIPA